MTTNLRDAYTFEPPEYPARTIVRDRDGQPAAVLTHGARTVVFTGPARIFTEPATTNAQVVTTSWVRFAARPFEPEQLDQDEFATWFLNAVADRSDDVLATAAQYVTGAPAPDSGGAGDARFGYEISGAGSADFYDYLGVPWTWTDGKVTEPEPRWAGHLDCSGYVRLVYGYRMGIPVSRFNADAQGLPRSSYAMADMAAAVTVAADPDPAMPPANLSRIQPGDLVFFALSPERPEQISHCGIYIGTDTAGGKRFVSSRQKADGPTFGDVGGRSVIDSVFFGPKLRRIIRL